MSTVRKVPPRPPITSTAEFARYVGLARTTVSRVLNGQPGLKENTIERVQRAIEETGFTPNAYATQLRNKRTATVGICIENLLTPMAVQKLALLQRRLRENHYSSLIEVFETAAQQSVIRHFLSMRVEAIVFIGQFDEKALADRTAEIAAHGLPQLVIDHFGPHQANTVSLDRAQAMREVTEHLLALGHRRFGLLGIERSGGTRHERLRGIRSALAAHGLAFEACTRSLDDRHPWNTHFDFGQRLARSFLEEKSPPTAFVALNDEVAAGALRALQEAGVRVPEDASVTGFNNQDLCLMTYPTLTTVDQQIEATVQGAAEVILSQVTPPGPRPLVRQAIPPLFVPRNSSGPAPR